jgi:hypothetical protein
MDRDNDWSLFPGVGACCPRDVFFIKILNNGSTSFSSGPGSGDLSDYKKLLDDNIRRNELLLSHLGFASADNGVDTQIEIAKAQLEWERAEFERERAEFVEKQKLRENNIRRNELLLISLGFPPAENGVRTRK